MAIQRNHQLAGAANIGAPNANARDGREHADRHVVGGQARCRTLETPARDRANDLVSTSGRSGAARSGPYRAVAVLRIMVQPACRSRVDGTLPKMTTPLMDKHRADHHRHRPRPVTLPNSHDELAAPRRDQTSVRPRHAVGVGSDDRRRSLAEQQGRKPDSDRDQAGDCQRMEHAKRVLSMQRQRRHIHEDKRKDVDGSDHSVGMGAFRHRRTAAPTSSAETAAENVSGGQSLFPIESDHQITTAMVCRRRATRFPVEGQANGQTAHTAQ